MRRLSGAKAVTGGSPGCEAGLGRAKGSLSPDFYYQHLLATGIVFRAAVARARPLAQAGVRKGWIC